MGDATKAREIQLAMAPASLGPRQVHDLGAETTARELEMLYAPQAASVIKMLDVADAQEVLGLMDAGSAEQITSLLSENKQALSPPSQHQQYQQYQYGEAIPVEIPSTPQLAQPIDDLQQATQQAGAFGQLRVDCVGAWHPYGPCQHVQEKNENVRCRDYEILRQQANGGAQCPFASGSIQCTPEGCRQPKDCVGTWTSFGSCNHITDTHTNERCREFRVTSNAAFNGRRCNQPQGFKQCTLEGCVQPVDCAGAWKEFECIQGRMCRTFEVTRIAQHAGFACPHEDQYQQCMDEQCTQGTESNE